MAWWRLAGLGIVAVTGALAAAWLLLPRAARALIGALELAVNACVWLAASLSAGVDAWTILATIARGVGGVLLTGRAVAVTAVLALVGAFALYGLQRLLGFEEESSR